MKKILITILQVCVAVAVLYWVFRDPEKRAQMLEALRQADKTWIMLGALLYGGVVAIGTFRWWTLLRLQEIRLSLGKVFQLFMIGAFFNSFMLGATGGDVVKIYCLLKEVPAKKATALLSVFMDRLIGLVALIILSCILVGAHHDIFLQNEKTAVHFWTLMSVLLFSITGIIISFLITIFDLADKLPAKIPLRDKFIELSAAYNLYGKAWKTSLFTLIISAIGHAACFGVFYCTARSVTKDISVSQIFSVMPIVNTITAIPISPSGVGVREFLFQELLGNLYGTSAHIATSISVLGFAIIIFWSILGGIIYLFYRPSEHEKLSVIGAEVSALEEKIVSE